MPHIHEKIDYIVETYIVHNNKVLLRLHDKYKIWLAVGGHIELDEEPEQAALREVWEEVGLKVELVGKREPAEVDRDGFRALIAPRFLNIHRVNPTHQHIGLIYFARSNSDKIEVHGDDVSNEIVWLTKEELNTKTDIYPDIKFYATKALEALSK
jgi:8-oxo-dGTP pyrophosphatase MutT (NUDIX family)